VPAADRTHRFRIVFSAFVGGLLALARPSVAPAGCNLLPQAQPIFRGALGTLDRPFAGPGDFVELHIRPTICDHTSPGLGTDPSNLAVTLLFTPTGGPKRAVVLTTQSCSDPALVAKLNACSTTPGMSAGGISCVHMNPLDADIVTRNDSIPRFRFRFPDTDAIVGPTGDDRTLSGPATIAVSHVADDLPCGLINDTCQATAAGLGLVACVDQLFARDGTCDSGCGFAVALADLVAEHATGNGADRGARTDVRILVLDFADGNDGAAIAATVPILPRQRIAGSDHGGAEQRGGRKDT